MTDKHGPDIFYQNSSTGFAAALGGFDMAIINSEHTSGLTDKFRMARVDWAYSMDPADLQTDASAVLLIADADYSEAELVEAIGAKPQGLNDKVDLEHARRQAFPLTDSDGNLIILSKTNPSVAGRTVINKTFQEDIGWNVWLRVITTDGLTDVVTGKSWFAKYYGKYFG